MLLSTKQNQTLEDMQSLRMPNQARQHLQQKMSSSSMEENTTIETADPVGSPKTLELQIIYIRRLDKSNFRPSHLSLRNIQLRIPLFKSVLNNKKIQNIITHVIIHGFFCKRFLALICPLCFM